MSFSKFLFPTPNQMNKGIFYGVWAAGVFLTFVFIVTLFSVTETDLIIERVPLIEQSNPEPVLTAVAKTIVALTDGKAVLNILEFRGDSAIVEINGRDTVAYKVR